MTVKVAIAFNNILFSKGIEKILEENSSDSVKVTGILGHDVRIRQSEVAADIILADFLTLYNRLTLDCRDKCVILFDTDCGLYNLISSIRHKGVRGIIRDVSYGGMLEKAILTVFSGGVWFDKEILRNIHHGFPNRDKKSAAAPQARKVIRFMQEIPASGGVPENPKNLIHHKGLFR